LYLFSAFELAMPSLALERDLALKLSDRSEHVQNELARLPPAADQDRG